MGTVEHRSALQKRKKELQELAPSQNYSSWGWSGELYVSLVLDFLGGLREWEPNYFRFVENFINLCLTFNVFNVSLIRNHFIGKKS